MINLISSILFIPSMVVGVIFECSRAGFDTGIEIANTESQNNDII